MYFCLSTLCVTKVTDEWSVRELSLIPYKGLTERLTYVLGGADDLMSSLEDSITSLSIIKASKYVAPIKVTPTVVRSAWGCASVCVPVCTCL